MARNKSEKQIALRHALNGLRQPYTCNDERDGYAVGSTWIDSAADNAYICTDATALNAQWELLSPGRVLKDSK